MKNWLISLVVFCITVHTVMGQSSFLSSIDRDIVFPDNFVNEYGWSSFLDLEIANKSIDLNDFDHNLFNATIFFMVNKFRNEGTVPSLKYAPAFESLAYHWLNYYPRSEIVKSTDSPNSRQELFDALALFDFNGAYAQMLAAVSISGDETTYLELAKEIVLNFKYRNSKVLQQPAFSDIGIRSVVEADTKFVTTVLVFGGYRLSWLHSD